MIKDLLHIPILVYHKVDPYFEWGVTRVYPFQFEMQMRYLKAKGWHTASQRQILSEDPLPPRTCLITFDDGYTSFKRYAFPILQRYGFRALVFVVTHFTGKRNAWDVTLGREFYHLSWSEINTLLSQGVEFGSHTLNHPNLTRIPLNKAQREIEDSKKMLEDKIGKEVHFFSYPFGKHNRDIEKLVENAGYKAGFTLCPRRGWQNTLYAIPRANVYLIDTVWDIQTYLTRKPKLVYWLEIAKERFANLFASGTFLLKGGWYEKTQHL